MQNIILYEKFRLLIRVEPYVVYILHVNEYVSFVFYLELFAFSDLFFSIWLNDIPSQMVVHLRPLPPDPNTTDTAFSNTDDFPNIQFSSSVLAIQKLVYTLRLNESTTS